VCFSQAAANLRDPCVVKRYPEPETFLGRWVCIPAFVRLSAI